MHLIPLDTSRACAFYCCTALEPQSQMSFNEGFRIPVPANALVVCSLQLSVCLIGPQAQEELLVRLKGSATQWRVNYSWSGVHSSVYNEMTFCVFLQGMAQLSLADCESNTEMVYHWLQVQMWSGADSQRPEQKSLTNRRCHDSQDEEQRPRAEVNTFTLLTLFTNHFQLSREPHQEIKSNQRATETIGKYIFFRTNNLEYFFFSGFFLF